MRDGANVASFEALARFKAALGEFTEAAQMSLSNASSDIRRFQSWLSHDQTRHWQQEIKKRTRMLAQAKSELHQAELQSRDTRPSCVIERKRLDQAKRHLEEAMRKAERVKHWVRMIEKEAMLYRGHTGALTGMLERDMPKAVVRMNRMMDSLEKYLKTAAPRLDTGESFASDNVSGADETDNGDPAP